jgi:hypothetical protein
MQITITAVEFNRRKEVEKAYYVYGSEIEFANKNHVDWEKNVDPSFDWSNFEYRIKEEPEPELDLKSLRGKWFKSKSCKVERPVAGIDLDPKVENVIRISDSWHSIKEFKRLWEPID